MQNRPRDSRMSNMLCTTELRMQDQKQLDLSICYLPTVSDDSSSRGDVITIVFVIVGHHVRQA